MALRHLRSLTLAIALAFALGANAQPADDAAVKALEKRLEDLLKEAAAIRVEIDKLKPPAPADDLTNVEVVSTPAPEAAPAPPPQDIQPVENAEAPSGSKIFNPDIAVIGTLVGHGGETNPFEFGPDAARAPFDLEEVETSFEAFVDPYAKGKFFLSIGKEGIEVEEGYAEFIALPWDLSAKAGKKKAVFGKANTWHTHTRPWVDQPLVIHNFFGDEGLADTGVSVSKIFPAGSVYTEVTAEVLSGSVEGVFERENQNDLFYNTHLRLFHDINENSNIELGTSYARGTTPGSGAHNQFAGIDVSYRWRPLQQGNYRGFIGRFEAMLNDRDDFDERLSGFYGSAEWKAAQRWVIGARIDQAERFIGGQEVPFIGARETDRGASLLLTFLPSEFSELRGQLRHTSYGGERSVTEFLLQLQFAIGAHGAHPF